MIHLNQVFSAEELAGLSAFAAMVGDIETESETQRVIRTLPYGTTPCK